MGDNPRRPPRSLSLFGLTGLLVAVGACAGGAKAPTDGPVEAARGRILRIVIDPNGVAHPDIQKVKKNVEIVLWVAVDGNLQIKFTGQNPFGQDVPCSGSYCGLITPPTQEGEFPYEATVIKGGSSMKLDPKLEVVP